MRPPARQVVEERMHCQELICTDLAQATLSMKLELEVGLAEAYCPDEDFESGLVLKHRY